MLLRFGGETPFFTLFAFAIAFVSADSVSERRFLCVRFFCDSSAVLRTMQFVTWLSPAPKIGAGMSCNSEPEGNGRL